MLSSPYPVPSDWLWRVLLIIGWIAGIAGGAWVIVSPPVSYAGLGLWLSILWGGMLIGGSTGALIGHITRRYRVEMAGLWPALGGAVLYTALSWEATLTGSPGSGPRACLMILLCASIAARIRVLRLIDRRIERLSRLGQGD